MSSRDTQWNNLPQTGEGTWLAGQEDIMAGMEVQELTGLIVYAGQLGLSTQWANIDLI